LAITFLALIAIQRRRARSRQLIETWEQEDANGGAWQGRVIHPDRDDTVH
jgi:hypothetical protein